MIRLSINKEAISKLPTAAFNGKIFVADTKELVDVAIDELRKYDMIGIDTETRPSFKKGVYHNVALLQLSTIDKCYLIRLNKTGFSDKVASLLEDESIMKIGLSLNDDIRRLHESKDFKPSNFVDLQTFVKGYGIIDNSLQRIFAIVFGQRISKGQRLSNWEAIELTNAQQNYAATDAWACLKIYNELIGNKFNPYDSKYILDDEITDEATV